MDEGGDVQGRRPLRRIVASRPSSAFGWLSAGGDAVGPALLHNPAMDRAGLRRLSYARRDRWSAEDVLWHYGGVSQAPIDVFDVADWFGVVVVEEWGVDSYLDPELLVCVLDEGELQTRQRAEVAMAIAVLVHQSLNRHITLGRVAELDGIPRRKRRYFRQFAAELLVPAWLLRIYVEARGADVSRLSLDFEVGERVIQARLRELDLIWRER